MRIALLAAIILLCGCAGDRLSLAPPPGVDFSGHWKLNEADSDDPMHLVQTANGASGPDSNTGNAGGRSGRGGGRGSMGGASPGLLPPAVPPLSVLGEAMRWPGKQLEIRQVAGVVAFTSDGKNRVCQPADGEKRSRHHGGSPDRDRDAPLPAARDAPPPLCGWLEKTLIVHGGDPEEERSPGTEERYSMAEDGQRLIEEIAFKGGRSNGFVASRVWDRVP